MCKICSSELGINSKGGGLRAHMLIKHTLEWLELFTEWYVGSKDNPLEFVSGEASKKILNERRVTNLFNPVIFFQPCEKDPKKGTCNICSQELLYSTSNGSLRRHVTRYDFTLNVNEYYFWSETF